MSNRLKRLCGAASAAVLVSSLPALAGAPSDLAQLDFFEKKIRPVLADNCYECHSADSKKVKGGLLLDTREGLEKGGDTGPAIVAGNPKKSLLLITMQHADPDPDMAMPPKKDQLPDSVLADFEEWIKMGAPDPRSGKTVAKSSSWDAAKAAEHWAFKPISNAPVPAPKDTTHFVQTPIDAFVLAKLAEKNLPPSPKADKPTLLRRVTYDLTGLPPTPAETEAFVADNASDALSKVVDRLLASPHYGERWGRHWLDIARYSDTDGDRLNGKRQPLFPYAWTYRDYVIDAFNRDLPYDQFIVEQLAADRLPESKDDKSKLAALGFLTVGKRFIGNEQDVIDDRIDVTTKGLMGLTGACARCHDHKFDPIPTKDYYSLHGVFNSSLEPEEQPVISEPPKGSTEAREYESEVAKLNKELEDFNHNEAARLLSGMIEHTGEYLLLSQESFTSTETRKKGDNLRLIARERGLQAEIAALWIDRLRALGKSKQPDPVMSPWLRFAALPEDQFAESGPDLANEMANADDVNPAIGAALAAKAPTSLKDVADTYTEVFNQLHDQLKLPAYIGQSGKFKIGQFDIAKTETKLTGPMESLRAHLFSGESPVMPGDELMGKTLGVTFLTPQTGMRARLVNLDFAHAGAPARAMTLVDRPVPRDSAVFIRGEPGNRGPIEPRHFLTVLSGGKPEPFKEGSGRLELARDIVDRKNPLTARVIVNRVWQWHFGQALVRTVSDFGTRSEPPTHPEMLDWLATWFMDNGWSMKKLHKLIIASSAYQEDSRANDRGMKADPTNQWLWRYNVQRLDFEEIRDTLLAIGGKLDLSMGGRPFTLGSLATLMRTKPGESFEPKTSPNRRTVYAMIDRAAVPDMFGAFDFANPDISTGERLLTTVPQQALFMMNSPFVVEQLRNLLAREDFPANGSDEDKVRFIFRAAFQRQPTVQELRLALEFLAPDVPPPSSAPEEGVTPAPEGAPAKPVVAAKPAKPNQPAQELNPWERYTQVVLLTNELVFLR